MEEDGMMDDGWDGMESSSRCQQPAAAKTQVRLCAAPSIMR
jgi:hypothetical protein